MGVFINNKRKNIQSSSKITKNNFKNFIVKAVSLIKGEADKRESLSAPEYDLTEIKAASEADSYVKMSLMKYSYMLFKAGYMLKSENQKAKDYITTRLYIMGICTKKPIEILFQEIGDDLIKYSNAFLVKSRVDKIMDGVQATGFFKDKPVGGYFRVDPATIYIQRAKNGIINKYVQVVDGEEKVFDPDDVIHFYLDKEAKNAFGTPRMIAALEDVKMLRAIEGNILTLIHRFSMPLFHWIIGKTDPGFQATQKEIEEAQNTIENMSLDGSVVTNEKTEIKAVGAEGTALNAAGYLTYFEKRVFSALGVSETQMGRGTSTGDADSMESQAHDTIKHIQQVFAIFVQYFIFNELLLEGGFHPLTNEKDRVSMVFNEISLDTKIKLENHEMNKFQSNMITFEEMRREIDKPEEVDESRLYQKMIIDTSAESLADVQNDKAIELAQAQGDVNIKVAKATVSNNQNSNSSNSNNSQTSQTYNGKGTKGNNVKGNGTQKSNQPNRAISNANTPENQYGKTSVKIKEAYKSKDVINSKKNHKKVFEDVYKRYYSLRNDIEDNPKDLDLLIPLGMQSIYEAIKIHMQIYSINGINDSVNDIQKLEKKKILLPSNNIVFAQFEDETRIILKKFLKDLRKRLKNDMSKNEIDDVFEAMEYRIRFLLEYILPKIYCFSYLKTGHVLKYKTAYIDFDGSDDEKSHNKIIDLDNINIDEIPPFHSFCDCRVYFKKGDS